MTFVLCRIYPWPNSITPAFGNVIKYTYKCLYRRGWQQPHNPSCDLSKATRPGWKEDNLRHELFYTLVHTPTLQKEAFPFNPGTILELKSNYVTIYNKLLYEAGHFLHMPGTRTCFYSLSGTISQMLNTASGTVYATLFFTEDEAFL